MKKTMKFMVSVLTLITATTGLFACGRGGVQTGGGDGAIDPTKSTLLVGNYDGGFGEAWLYKAKERFEKAYADVSFEEGKKGVQVRIDTSYVYAGTNMSTYIGTWDENVIFAEAIDYYDLANKGLISDISDAVTKPLNENIATGEVSPIADTNSIEEIISDSMKKFYKTSDGKYYGLPFYEATVGIVYDIDLFDEYGFYFCADGYGDNEGFAQSMDGWWIGQNGAELGNAKGMTFEEVKSSGSIVLSNGVDGKAGTEDDGLPATYDEYFKLCERIEALDMESTLWPGDVQGYSNYFAYNLWADYEGLEQMNLNYYFNGIAENLIDTDSYNANTKTFNTYSEMISEKNGYLLNQQAGKYYAIDFIKRLTENVKHYDERNAFSGDVNQDSAQNLFLTSALPGQKRIAMLIDGSWWQNEASGTFEEMASQYNEKYSAKNRRFGFLPLPKATADKVGETTTRAQLTATLCCINATATKNEDILALSKEFIRFCHSQESLAEFTVSTDSCKPYEYGLSSAQLAQLSEFGRQSYQMHCNSEFLFSLSAHPISMASPKSFSADGETFKYGVNSYMTTTFKNSGISSWDYFKGIIDSNTKEIWETKYALAFTSVEKLIAVGDSITVGTYMKEDNSYTVAEPNYMSLLQEAFGAKVLDNRAINGISYSSTSSVNSQYAFANTCASVTGGDMIVVALGTNDYGTNVALGAQTDTEDVSFYGAVDFSLRTLKANNPNAEILVVLPFVRLNENTPNEAGHTLDDYRNAIRYKAEQLGLIVIDGSLLPVDPANAGDTAAYIYDGVHFNVPGQKLLAQLVYSQYCALK